MHKERIGWLDFVRCLAIVMVVIVHTLENTYSFTQDGVSALSGAQQVFVFCWFTFGRLGVPLFMFLTGYLLIGRDYSSPQKIVGFWKNKLLLLVIAYEIWTLVYEIFCALVLKIDFSIETCLKRMLFIENFALSNMWYMPMIIGIYLLLPLISYVVQKMPLSVLVLPMIACFLYYFVAPAWNTVAVCIDARMITRSLSLEFTGGEYGLYVITGYVFNRLQSKINGKWKSVVVLAVFLISFAAAVYFQIWSYQKGSGYNIWYNSPILYICASSLFGLLFMLREKIKNRSMFKSISVAALGIYFIHNMILNALSLYVMPLVGITRRSIRAAVLILICFFVSYALGEALAAIPGVSKFMLLRNKKKK